MTTHPTTPNGYDAPRQFDVAVLGGGPAGVVVACQLVAFGYEVALVHAPRRFFAIEGLSRRAFDGLAFAGCKRALAGVTTEVKRVAHWNGTSFDGNREFIVSREAFDSGLIADARAAGVHCFAERATRTARTPSVADEHAHHWDVDLANASRTRTIRARYLIDARGRFSPHRRDAWRKGAGTLSVGCRFAAACSDSAKTIISTGMDGWLWAVDDGRGTVSVQGFIAKDDSAFADRTTLTRRFHERWQANANIEPIARGADVIGKLFVRDATPMLHNNVVDSGRARIGDAALGLDPLAGHGLYEAVGGALTLAPVVNTLLRQPESAALAKRFYAQKLEHDFLRLARIGRDFYREETRWPAADFWSTRQAWPDDEPAHAPPMPGDARIESKPVSVDGYIALKEVVVTADHPRGVWQIAGVPVASLWQLADAKSADHATPADIVRVAAERLQKPTRDVSTALAWLKSRRLVVDAIR